MRQVGARIMLCLLVLSAILGSAGCSRPAPVEDVGAGIVTDDLGAGMRAYRQENSTPVGIVVWFHGMDSDGTEFGHNPKHRHFAEPFLRDGWVVASASAGGNSFGNDDAIADYRRLITAAEHKYRTRRLLFVGESMGTVGALLLYAEQEFAHIDGLVGVSPLTGIPPTLRGVDFIAGAWGGTVPARADPLSAPASVYDGRRFLLFYSTGDTVVPSGAGARAFAIRFGKRADVSLMLCRGGHVDGSCYGGDAALAFADQATQPAR
ncbi:alpha/beta hydrolase [Gordonia sp. NPDC003424]